MGNPYYRGAVETKCPYYDHETLKSITCMGITETSVMTNFFKSAKAKMQFQDNNCFKWETCKCKDCIIREMLDAIFEDQEDRAEEKKSKTRGREKEEKHNREKKKRSSGKENMQQ